MIGERLRTIGGLLALAVLGVAVGTTWLGGSGTLAAGAPAGTTGAIGPAADQPVVDAGRQLFVANCASCHGPQGEGASGGPSLVGVGAASADFYLRTGRMPLSAPGQQAVRQAPHFGDPEIEALVAYVASLGDGPPIPQVSAGGDLHRGWQLFQANCAACHNARARETPSVAGSSRSGSGRRTRPRSPRRRSSARARCRLSRSTTAARRPRDVHPVPLDRADAGWRGDRPDRARRRGVHRRRDRPARPPARVAVRRATRARDGATPDGGRRVARRRRRSAHRNARRDRRVSAAPDRPAVRETPTGRPNPVRERRAERAVLAAFGVTGLSGIALLVVYALGGQTQIEGILLALCLGGLGRGHRPVGAGADVRGAADRAPASLGRRPGDERGGRGRPHRRGRLQPAPDPPGAGWVARWPGLPRRSSSRCCRSVRHPAGACSARPGRRVRAWWGSTAVAVNASSIPPDGVVTVFPEGFAGNAEAQTVLINAGTGRLQLEGEAAEWAPDGFVAYSKVCTHAGCPVGLYRASQGELICPCHQSTFDVMRGAVPTFGPGGPAAAPAPDPARGRRHVHRAGRLPGARRPVVLEHGDRADRARRRRSRGFGAGAVNRLPPARRVGGRPRRAPARGRPRPAPQRGRRGAAGNRRGPARADGAGAADGLAGRADGARRPRADDVAQGVPRSLVVPAGRGRAVLLRDPRADGDLPHVLLRAVRGTRRVHRPVPATPGRRGVSQAFDSVLYLVVRGPGGAAVPPDPPLDRGRVRRGRRRASRPGVLHRRVPAPARDQLADRVRAARVRPRGGVHRLLAAGRPAVRDRGTDRVQRGDLDPVHRAVPRLARVRRRVPDGRVPAPLLRPPRDAPAGAVRRRHRRARRARVPPEAHPVARPPAAQRQRGRAALLARPGVPLARGCSSSPRPCCRRWAGSCRSTRSGRTGRSSPRS